MFSGLLRRFAPRNDCGTGLPRRFSPRNDRLACDKIPSWKNII